MRTKCLSLLLLRFNYVFGFVYIWGGFVYIYFAILGYFWDDILKVFIVLYSSFVWLRIFSLVTGGSLRVILLDNFDSFLQYLFSNTFLSIHFYHILQKNNQHENIAKTNLTSRGSVWSKNWSRVTRMAEALNHIRFL